MIRSSLVLLAVAAMIVTALALSGEAGHASLVWMGWRLDMTAAAAIMLLLGSGLTGLMIWRLLLWVLEAPQRAERARADARHRQASEVLTRGFLAVAAGDGLEARRLAATAADLAQDQPGLVRLLAAQAAEAAGDGAGAQSAFSAMLGFPNMRLAGHRGLMHLALAQGDQQAALLQAEAAYDQAKTARWAWRALFEARLEAGDWEAARGLLKGGLDRKIVSPIVAERGRTALLAASAARIEDDHQAKSEAIDFATRAAKLQPGFAPGSVLAARLLAADRKTTRAGQVIEAAWRIAPHPALWLIYRDLITRETPRQRATRLAALASLNPDARESRILQVELALLGGDPPRALVAAQALETEPVTARLAGLMARTHFAAGQTDNARMWLAKGVGAPTEADWSDLDAEGRAFAYPVSDWARLAATYAETGMLIHPRLERRERGLAELPDLPISYADSTSFLGEEPLEPMPYSLAEDLYEGDNPPPPRTPPPIQRRSPARRRLASGPRPAK